MPGTTAWGAQRTPTTTTTPTEPHSQREPLELHRQLDLLETPRLMRRQETSKRGMMMTTWDKTQGATVRCHGEDYSVEYARGCSLLTRHKPKMKMMTMTVKRQ